MKGVATGLEMLVRRFPNQVDFWYNLGVAHLNLDNPRRAVEVLQRAFVLAPRNRQVGRLLARALAAARYRPAAVETLRLMTREYPEDLDLLLELGRACEADSRPEEAFLAYRAALDLTPEPAAEHYLLLIRTAVPIKRLAEAQLFLDRYVAAGGSAEQARSWRSALSPKSR
jgi:tetratricopeptide (TPR) repeat protein